MAAAIRIGDEAVVNDSDGGGRCCSARKRTEQCNNSLICPARSLSSCEEKAAFLYSGVAAQAAASDGAAQAAPSDGAASATAAPSDGAASDGAAPSAAVTPQLFLVRRLRSGVRKHLSLLADVTRLMPFPKGEIAV